MQIVPASTNPPSQSSTDPTATDSSEPSKTSGDAGETTATATFPGEASHTTGDAGDASATEQPQNALNPKAPTSPQASTDPVQVSNENNGSQETSTETGVPAIDAEGAAASSPNLATTPDASLGQPIVAAASPNTQTSTPEVNAQAPNIAATTPKTATKWTPWSLLSGIFSNRVTTPPVTNAPPIIIPTTTTPPVTTAPTTSQAPVVNNPMQTLSLSGDIAVALPVTTTGGNQLQQYPTITTSAKNRKRRKNQATALNIMKRKRIRPTIIDDVVALSILKELGMTRGFLEKGKILAWALQPDDIDFSNIYDYVARSQDTGPGIKILSIIRIIPKADALQDDDGPAVTFSDDPNVAGKLRKMLWHGTKQKVISSILENGLRLPVHPGWFGKGIYFADRISNSVFYTDNGSYRQGTAHLLLCDVLLGEVYKANRLMVGLTKAPKHHVQGRGLVDCDSVLGCGYNVPDEGWNMKIDGCTWPLGPTVQIPRTGSRMVFQNEFIVYDTKQVQPKYLVKVELSRNPIYESLY